MTGQYYGGKDNNFQNKIVEIAEKSKRYGKF